MTTGAVRCGGRGIGGGSGWKFLATTTLRSVVFTLLAVWLTGCAHTLPAGGAQAPMRYGRDTFAFTNETVWKYQGGKVAAETRAKKERDYTRRCFVMARGAVQFWKFAQFDSRAPIVSDAELARRIQRVAAVPVWTAPWPRRERIDFPGYASLHDLSARAGPIVRANLGEGWPTYFRVGNMPMVFPVSAAHQARTARELDESLALGQPRIVWIYNFPELNINHAIVAYRRAGRDAQGRTTYLVYDPNDDVHPGRLSYDPAMSRFAFARTFYFPGGTVQVRPIFLSAGQ